MKGTTPTCFGVVCIFTQPMPPVESRAPKEANLPICSFGAEFSSHFKFPARTYVFSFCHPGRSFSLLLDCRESVQLLFMAAAAGRAKEDFSACHLLKHFGPPQLDSQILSALFRGGCSQLDPCSAMTLRKFSSNSPFNDHVQSQHSQPPLSLSLIPLHYSFTSKSAEIHGSCSAGGCLGKLAIILYPFNFY